MRQQWQSLLQQKYIFIERNCADAVLLVLKAGLPHFDSSGECKRMNDEIVKFKAGFIIYLTANPEVVFDNFKC